VDKGRERRIYMQYAEVARMMKQILERRSIRKYLDKPVDDGAVMELLEGARLAPSGSNTQPWHFIIIRDPELKRELAKASHGQEWMLSAPVFIACVADVRARIKDEGEIGIDEESPRHAVKQIIRDTSIAVEHIVLEAIDHGLGTCWVAWFIQDEIRPLLGLARDKYLVCILTLGHPAEEPPQRERHQLKDIVHHEKW
jgi:nitroreductase